MIKASGSRWFIHSVIGNFSSTSSNQKIVAVVTPLVLIVCDHFCASDKLSNEFPLKSVREPFLNGFEKKHETTFWGKFAQSLLMAWIHNINKPIFQESIYSFSGRCKWRVKLWTTIHHLFNISYHLSFFKLPKITHSCTVFVRWYQIYQFCWFYAQSSVKTKSRYSIDNKMVLTLPAFQSSVNSAGIENSISTSGRKTSLQPPSLVVANKANLTPTGHAEKIKAGLINFFAWDF